MIGPDCVLDSHVVIERRTVLGSRNRVHPFAVIGGEAQELAAPEGDGRVVIGDDNVIREHVTINVGSRGDCLTTIGNGNLIMSGCHIGHDSKVHDSCVIASGTQIAGHVEVHDVVRVGGGSAIAEWVRLGTYSFVAGKSTIDRDVLPFGVAVGERPKVHRACNLRPVRRHFEPKTAQRIRRTVREWMDLGGEVEAFLEAMSRQEQDWLTHSLVEFVRGSRVGVIR